METTFFQKNLTNREEKAFLTYVNDKITPINNLLTKFSKDAQFLKISIEKFNKHDAYEVEFSLKLPTKSMVAKETSHTITKAVDLAKDRMISQIKKHTASLRERTHKSIRETEESPVEIFQIVEK
jgi:ribosome-associated translation inhibitor RaiA